MAIGSGSINASNFSVQCSTEPDRNSHSISRSMDNGTTFENGHVNGAATGGSNVVEMDYTTDFPSLPVTAAAAASSSATNEWSRPRPVATKTVTQMFTLSPEERANRVKSFGATSEETKRVQGIAAATGCRIETSESKDGSLTVIIKGLRNKVEDARSRLVRELQTQNSANIDIPKDHHRKLIGKEGAALKELESNTNCRIVVPTRDQPSETIKITGPREGIQKAVAFIKNLSEREAKLAIEHIVCPKILYPFIRGPFNETYDKLTENGVKINIPPSHANSEVISVTGEREGVLRAAAAIRSIVKEKESTVKSVTCQVAKAQHRFIIGQQRKGLHEILKETGVSVEVPNEEDNSDTITLRGDPTKLSEALALVYARASSVITQKIDCPTWLHKQLIGPKGATLQALVPNRGKVQIDFDDAGFIFFEGSPEEVKPAFEVLSKEVDRLVRSMSMEKVKVHPSLHRHVIGRQGANISKIKEECKVQISIPNEQMNSDEITIEGETAGVKKAAQEIRKIVAKIENEKSRDIIIEQRLHKNIIGSKGANMQDIRTKYPSVTVSFPDQNKKSDVINIRGDKTEVDAVYNILNKQYKTLLESNYQQSVPIFKEFHKNIIGKGGANIKKIREETNTRIELPDGTSGEERILVTGKKADVEKAIKLLEQQQNELASIVTIELEIPVKVQSRLLGSGRRLIQNIEEECGGVHIKFPSEKSESTKVTVRGPKEDAARAEKLLSDIAKDKEQNLHEDTVTAKTEFHRFLIGKGGAKIKALIEKYDVRIMFPREADTDKETIHLLGKKDDVLKLKEEIEASVKQLNETVEIKVEVDPKYHKHFLQRGAPVLKEIQQQNGSVTISFPRAGATEEASTVSIKGSKQCAESAKLRIEEIVDDLDHQTTIQIEIDKSKHGAILGDRGANVQRIQAKHGVNISIPRSDANPEDRNIVIITGRDTHCEAAKEDLLLLVPIDRTIAIPIHYHVHLIGERGKILREFNEQHNVNVKIPKKGEEASEIVTVSGTPENVEVALEALQKKLLDFFHITIEVPVEYQWRIIGAGGKTIDELKRNYKVQINIPKNESETITIVGPEDNARACAEDIENRISEYRSMFTQEISLAAGYHPRLIGQRGKNLQKVQEKFNVEIRIPRSDAADPNLVIVAGKTEDDVYDCIDYLRAEEEEWLQDHHERTMYQVQRAPEKHQQQKPSAMQINNAPWQMDMEQFPDMGSSSAAPTQSVGGAWGGPRRW